MKVWKHWVRDILVRTGIFSERYIYEMSHIYHQCLFNNQKIFENKFSFTIFWIFQVSCFSKMSNFYQKILWMRAVLLDCTPPRMARISRLKSQVLKPTFVTWKRWWKLKSGLEFFILKFQKPIQICCCPVQKKSAQKGWIGLAG